MCTPTRNNSTASARADRRTTATSIIIIIIIIPITPVVDPTRQPSSPAPPNGLIATGPSKPPPLSSQHAPPLQVVSHAAFVTAYLPTTN